MAAPVAASPYSEHVRSYMIQSVSEFLGWRVSLATYACVDRSHQAGVLDGLPKAMTVPSGLVNQLFANIEKFRKLQDLTINGSKFSAIDRIKFTPIKFTPLALPHGTGKIDRLTFKDKVATPNILMFLEAIPNLKGLSFLHELDFSNTERFRPIEGERLTDVAGQNLTALTDLHLHSAKINPQVFYELLQRSNNLSSVTLHGQGISNAILAELARQPNLTHLSLSYVKGEVDYRILSGCHSLESFVPPSGMAEEDLLAIIQANPRLTTLDLSENPIAVPVTDRVLQAIGTNLPELSKLKIGFSKVKISDLGFTSLIRGCPQLSSLILGSAQNISVAALSELRNCSKLKVLQLGNANLSDDFLAVLAAMSQITELSLSFGKGCSEEGLLQLHVLVNLKWLDLEGIEVRTGAVITGFIDHCPRLESLNINRWSLALTIAALQAVRSAILERRSDLRHLYCLTSSLGAPPYKRIHQLREELPRLKIL